MDTKICCICKNPVLLEEFNISSKGTFGRGSRCKKCQNQYSKNHYKANKSKYLIRGKNHYIKIRQYVIDYLKEHPCIDCGEADLVVLEFDHIRDKTYNISSMMKRKCSWESIAKEIEKCEVRCANCHKRRTAKQFGWFKGIT